LRSLLSSLKVVTLQAVKHNKQEITKQYADKAAALGARIATLRQRNRFFVLGELLSFLAVVGLVAAYAVGEGLALWLWLAALMAAVYLLVRWLDVRNSLAIARAEDLHSVYQKELSYMASDFSVFPSGSQYADAHHAFTFDMDIFGEGSLFNRLNRTITTGGSDALARRLALNEEGGAATAASISIEREAISELAEDEPLRAAFMSYGQRSTIDTQEIGRVLAGMKSATLPSWAASTFALVAVLLVLACFYALLAANIFGMIGGSPVGLWAVLQLCAAIALFNRPLRTAGRMADKIHKQLKAYIDIIRLMTESHLHSEGNRKLLAQVADATDAFSELHRIIDSLDRRGHFLYLMFSDIFLLGDFFLVRRFLRWQSRHLLSIGQWIEAVGQMDARVSMATFRYNEPQAVDAEVVDSDEVVFSARALYHPFLGEKAVKNDFDIADGHYYIITGANMAGKSTFLRAIGVNCILARCGLPAFADSLRISVFTLFSSMRTTDDLTRGISYFNAELLRLRQLLDTVGRSRRTLIILDEILKGTNSLDKLNGSRLFLEAVAAMPVTGVIATHDLELSKMADDRPDRFHNYCFEIRLSDDITYTYKIAPGVAKNQNATYLLRRILQKQ